MRSDMAVLCKKIKERAWAWSWCCTTMHMLANFTDPIVKRVSSNWAYEMQMCRRTCDHHKAKQ